MDDPDGISLETLVALSETHQKYIAEQFLDLKVMIAGQNTRIEKNRQTGEENRNAITGLRTWVRLVGVVNSIGNAIAAFLGLS